MAQTYAQSKPSVVNCVGIYKNNTIILALALQGFSAKMEFCGACLVVVFCANYYGEDYGFPSMKSLQCRKTTYASNLLLDTAL